MASNNNTSEVGSSSNEAFVISIVHSIVHSIMLGFVDNCIRCAMKLCLVSDCRCDLEHDDDNVESMDHGDEDPVDDDDLELLVDNDFAELLEDYEYVLNHADGDEFLKGLFRSPPKKKQRIDAMAGGMKDVEVPKESLDFKGVRLMAVLGHQSHLKSSLVKRSSLVSLLQSDDFIAGIGGGAIQLQQCERDQSGLRLLQRRTQRCIERMNPAEVFESMEFEEQREFVRLMRSYELDIGRVCAEIGGASNQQRFEMAFESFVMKLSEEEQ